MPLNDTVLPHLRVNSAHKLTATVVVCLLMAMASVG
jgi:hypothetical protein